MEGKGDNSQRGQAERMWVSDMGGGGVGGRGRGGIPQIMSSDPGPVAQSSGSPSLAILQTQLWVAWPIHND